MQLVISDPKRRNDAAAASRLLGRRHRKRRLREIEHLDGAVGGSGDNGPSSVGINVEVDPLIGGDFSG